MKLEVDSRVVRITDGVERCDRSDRLSKDVRELATPAT